MYVSMFLISPSAVLRLRMYNDCYRLKLHTFVDREFIVVVAMSVNSCIVDAEVGTYVTSIMVIIIVVVAVVVKMCVAVHMEIVVAVVSVLLSTLIVVVCVVSVVVAMIADCFNHMVLRVVCIVMFLCNELNTPNFAVRGSQYY